MSEPRIVSLFSGYGGLEMGIQSVLGGEVIAHVEFDDAPSRILTHHWPHVPNLGDVTAVDWEMFLAEHPELDEFCGTYRPGLILCGGFPCQDVSLAGLRRGLKDGTRSGLWSEFARAIDALRPELVVIENVRGLLSAEADRKMESDPWGVGNRVDGPALRALGAVLGDLADLGYDAEWCGVRAADAGAPHGRFRVFIVAYPAGQLRAGRDDGLTVAEKACGGWIRESTGDSRSALAEDADLEPRGERRLAASGEAPSGRSRSDARGRGRASAANTRSDDERRGTDRDVAGSQGPDQSHQEERQRHGDATPHRDATAQWGPYAAAVLRWERVIGRVAPSPTNPDGRDGGARLAPQFVEWLMGLPEGHVTSAPITRAQQLKALGNGVVPQQAALAVRTLLQREEVLV